MTDTMTRITRDPAKGDPMSPGLPVRAGATRKRKPRLLDLFCGAGGCSVGYARAGFDVTGLDLEGQPNYPFEFVRADALAADLSGFDAIAASPPCQAYSRTRKIWPDNTHADLVAAVRKKLQASRLPYVIENVEGAPLHMPVRLCGTMFGLAVYRHRLFESSHMLFTQDHRTHRHRCARVGYERKSPHPFRCVAGHFADPQGAARAMGIDWKMTREELAQAVPPSYTEYLGKQLMRQLANATRTRRNPM